MKAITQDAYGPADLLRLTEVETPVAGPGEVLIRVRAAGVDYGVWHLMTGLPLLTRAFGFGLRKPKNRIPGMDVAGVVEAVGAGVTPATRLAQRIADEIQPQRQRRCAAGVRHAAFARRTACRCRPEARHRS